MYSAFRPATRRCAAGRCYRRGRWQLDGLIRRHAWCRSRHGLDWSFGTGMPPAQNTSTAAAKIDTPQRLPGGAGVQARFQLVRLPADPRAPHRPAPTARGCDRRRQSRAPVRAAWRAAIRASICGLIQLRSACSRYPPRSRAAVPARAGTTAPAAGPKTQQIAPAGATARPAPASPAAEPAARAALSSRASPLQHRQRFGGIEVIVQRRLERARGCR